MRDLRLSVIDRCNFRCTYCMPKESLKNHEAFLSRRKLLSDNEIEQLTRAFVNLGVSKIRITGGEPLLRPGLVGLIERIASIPQVKDLALITNGILLPQMAHDLADAGLGRITVSLDSLDETVFSAITGGRGTVARVREGIGAAEDAGFTGLKINTVVQRGVNDHKVMEMVRHFRGTGHILRLIEFMDVGNSNHWGLDRVVPGSEWLERIHKRWPLRPLVGHYPGEVARRYAFEDGAGEIGLINSITEPFCGNCSRARVTADGVLHNCLFSGRGTNLRPFLTNSCDPHTLEQRIRSTWSIRQDQDSKNRHGQDKEEYKIEMYQLGG
jgi:cyclic pyranopterin phosphate synthase